MHEDKLKQGFEAWLSEPAYDGKPNGNHLNTRATDTCEIAFKAGVDWAEEQAKRSGDVTKLTEAEIAALERLQHCSDPDAITTVCAALRRLTAAPAPQPVSSPRPLHEVATVVKRLRDTCYTLHNALESREPTDEEVNASWDALHAHPNAMILDTFICENPAPAPARHLTVTTNEAGQAVLVSWQDDEHRILETVWEAPAPAEGVAVPAEGTGNAGPGYHAGAAPAEGGCVKCGGTGKGLDVGYYEPGPCPACKPATPSAAEAPKPVATLHADGFWTWKSAEPHAAQYAGWTLDVYATPPMVEAGRGVVTAAMFAEARKAASNKLTAIYLAGRQPTDAERDTIWNEAAEDINRALTAALSGKAGKGVV